MSDTSDRWTRAGRSGLDQLRRAVARLQGQVRGGVLLRRATRAIEEEDFEAARALFVEVIGIDAPRSTRLMAYHGAVVAMLRLGHFEEALKLGADALVLVRVAGKDDRAEQVHQAMDALEEAMKFAKWAIDHPSQIDAIKRREQQDHQAQADPEPFPLGLATAWPPALQAGYRLVLQGLMAAGLVAAAVERRESARRLLVVARLAARFDRRLERDACWHLSRIDEELGLEEDARQHRARYEELNQRVRQALRRFRWTN